jgi:hypothetical protein
MRVARCCPRGGRRWRCSALTQRMTAADWRGSTKNGAARAGAEGVARPALALDLGYRRRQLGMAGAAFGRVRKQGEVGSGRRKKR